ncbi:MAG: hypothetical protein KDC38_19925 [Planctomycetes bacterium]|nr:hypothetical protein [Planctomycetota bacterium]
MRPIAPSLTILSVLLVSFIISSTARGQQVLVYDPSVQQNIGEQAAIDAGYTVTAVVSDVAFDLEVSTGTWDLISIDVPSSGMTQTVVDAVANHIAAGGKAMIGFWNLDAAIGDGLRTAFQVETAVDYTFPLPIYAWDVSHPIFTVPNLIASPIPIGQDAWADDGDRMTAAATSVELGGFVDTATTGEAAIILGNDGRTICNGFVYDSFVPTDLIPLIQNEMAFLIGGSGGGVEFRRGDVNVDGVFDISDPVFALASLFIPGSPEPGCGDASDANDDGIFDISDAVYALASLFIIGAPPPPSPGGACGTDPTPDSLDCLDYPTCP